LLKTLVNCITADHDSQTEGIAVSLEDRIAKERQRLREEARVQELARARAAAERAWLSDRLYASPDDEVIGPPPPGYEALVAEVVRMVPRPLWSMGYLYRDLDGKTRLTTKGLFREPIISGIASSDFWVRRRAHRELGQARTRTNELNHRLRAQLASDATPLAYLSHNNSYSTYTDYGGSSFTPATWSFTVVEDGRAGHLFGTGVEIEEFLTRLVLSRDADRDRR
jgi:hypothetical protein